MRPHMPRVAQKFEKIAFIASDVPEARAALERLSKVYGHAEPSTLADHFVFVISDAPSAILSPISHMFLIPS